MQLFQRILRTISTVIKSDKSNLALILLFSFHGIAAAGQLPGTCSSGSVHDLNSLAQASQDPYGRVCVFCHVPHEAYAGVGPIWSRPDNNPSGLKPYTWATPDNMEIPFTDPLIGPSRLCLTCHDGVTAMDSHGARMPSDKVISKNLNFTHPIGFNYDDARHARGENELVDKSQAFAQDLKVSDTPGVYNFVSRTGLRRIVDVLFEGKYVTCSSCHDVHNCNNVTPESGHDYNYLLLAKEEKSLLCLSCHIK